MYQSSLYIFSSVQNATYKSKMSLKFFHAIETSLIYRDNVFFEGKPTGIMNEYSLELNPQDTKMDFMASFETEIISLPKYSGWYTVRAMITNRFEQILFEWSFQFHVDNEWVIFFISFHNILSSKNSTENRLKYINQLDERFKKYREENSEIKWSKEETLKVRKAYSHGSDLA